MFNQNQYKQNLLKYYNMVSNTQLKSVKCCSRCGETKETDKFIKARNICKKCSNARKLELLHAKLEVSEKCCRICEKRDTPDKFIKYILVCKDCHNLKRVEQYKNNPELRDKKREEGRVYNQKITKIRQEKRQVYLQQIGEGNKKCSVCSEIKPKERFRYNRLKCRTCERDDPLDKFKRGVRSRIYIALNHDKQMNTIKYLGTSSAEYIQWILHNDQNYTLENRGKVWHIDHVIPLSRFDLTDEQQQFIAFNWRNTMPLAAKENLSKNHKIIPSQIEQHYRHLLEYHKEKNMEIPQTFVDLFARYLVAGTALEPSLPLIHGNVNEELG